MKVNIRFDQTVTLLKRTLLVFLVFDCFGINYLYYTKNNKIM